MVISVERLKQIEAEIRSLSDMSGSSTVVDVMGTCVDLFAETIELGLFSDANHADLRAKITEAKIEAEQISPKFWRNYIFNALARHFAVLFVQEYGHRLACGPIADAIAKEIDRIKTLSVKTEQGQKKVNKPTNKISAAKDKNRGGRPMTSEQALKIIKTEDVKTPKPKDEFIAGLCSRAYSVQIARGKRKKFTAGAVRNLRSRYLKSKQNQ